MICRLRHFVPMLLLFLLAARDAAADKVDFRRDIQPILANKCFVCHGRDAEHRQGKLRLDQRDSALAGGESGEKAIVPGQPEQSELVRRIESTDDDQRMPPATFKKSLTAAERELLRRWVTEGAEYQEHWAFIAPVRPKLPEVKRQDWARNDIDRFILARLEKEGLSPSPETDKVTLLRRVTLDLIGLPPTLAEVDAFVADQSPQAYEKVVQRLLDSPHYGERWGRIWLDGARYADSDGYEKDKPRFVWAYRDWVVSAFNRDLPYNQFLIEQLAGDLLPNATQDQLVATGFLRNSMINEEGGIDPEQFRMEAMFDRMDAIGKGMLGLTLGCAQCHDHKYDPLTQEDYYRVFAFFNDTHEANVPVYPGRNDVVRALVMNEIMLHEASLKTRIAPDWEAKMDAWAKSVRGDQPAWTVVSPAPDVSGGQKHYVLKDGSILAAGYAPTKHTTEFVVKTELENVTAIRLELLNDPNLPMGGPGRSIKGTSALTEFKVEAGPADGSAGMKEVKVVSATADVNPAEKDLDTIYNDKTNKRRVTGPIEFAVDGKDETAWGTDNGPGRRNVPRKAVFVLETPASFPGGVQLKIKLVQNHGGWNSDDNQNHNLGRFRFAVTSQADAKADPLPVNVRPTVESWGEEHSAAEMAEVFSYFRTTVPAWQGVNEAIEQSWKHHPEPTSQLALRGREPENRRATFMLNRGDFLKPTREVQPGTPGFLHKLTVEKPTRLDFARWLVDEKAPTTARSIVNRLWQGYFGTGLTATSEDFGTQGEAPSHGELLDYLATELVQQRWSLKHLQRLIVTSATYRQSSRVSPELLSRDQDNRLLARGPRLRLDAEGVRDAALAISGLLTPKVGGPPVFPPAPEFLFLPPTSYGPKVWKEEKGENRYRRALYTFRFRSVPYPVLQAFDAPNGDFSCVRRTRSNTPLQALATLNEPLFLECARALALKSLQEGGKGDQDRIAYAFRRCVSRAPDEAELAALVALLQKQVTAFSQEGAKPWDLAANDPQSPPALPEGVTPAQAAAWTVVSRVLLNMDETITKE